MKTGFKMGVCIIHGVRKGKYLLFRALYHPVNVKLIELITIYKRLLCSSIDISVVFHK